MVRRPDYLPLHYKVVFNLSKAYRAWPHVAQPDSKLAGFYSTNDHIVIPAYAKEGYQGELIELSGLSHSDLVRPQMIGPHLTRILSEIYP